MRPRRAAASGRLFAAHVLVVPVVFALQQGPDVVDLADVIDRVLNHQLDDPARLVLVAPWSLPEIAAQIVAGQADDVLALKANHPDRFEDVTDCFTMATTPDHAKRTVEKNHGRLEVRVCETISDPAVIA